MSRVEEQPADGPPDGPGLASVVVEAWPDMSDRPAHGTPELPVVAELDGAR